jgi:hypothetical protein
MLINAKWAIFSVISWQEQGTFQWGDEGGFVLDQHA